jgi:UDP-N-acetylglucosamine 4-epimerase
MLSDLYAQLDCNLLPQYSHLQAAKPVQRDLRAGDMRHSLADIGKAATRLGYSPRQRIGQGLAMPWYIGKR